MADYFDREHDRTFTRVYKNETPDILQSFLRFDEAVFTDEGREIPLKYRELIAVAVGISTQCVYCIDGHTQRAIKAEPPRPSSPRPHGSPTAIRAGGGFAHGRLAFKFADQATHQH